MCVPAVQQIQPGYCMLCGGPVLRSESSGSAWNRAASSGAHVNQNVGLAAGRASRKATTLQLCG